MSIKRVTLEDEIIAMKARITEDVLRQAIQAVGGKLKKGSSIKGLKAELEQVMEAYMRRRWAQDRLRADKAWQ